MSEPAVDQALPQSALKGAVAAHLIVSGMDCERCATRVRQALLRLGGVASASVSLGSGVAVIAYDPKRTFPVRLLEAVRRAANDGRHRFDAAVVRIQTATELPGNSGIGRGQEAAPEHSRPRPGKRAS